MNQSKFGHFLTGALVGVGLGIIFAPKEGSKTRNELQKSLKQLVDSIKEIDLEETKAHFFDKVSELQKELSSISKEEATDYIKDKISIVKEKCDDLKKEANKEDLPAIEKQIDEIKEKSIYLLKQIMEEIKEEEKLPEVVKKKTKKGKK